MKLYTLGTSHGRAESTRSCSGTLLQVNDDLYLLDCGCDVSYKAASLKLPIERLKAVFVSHMHADHVVSLPSIMKLFTVYIKRNEPVKFFLPEQHGIDTLLDWFGAMHIEHDGKRFAFEEVKGGEIYSDENITVSAVPTEHILNGKFPSFAYDITVGAENKRILYTGDLAYDFHDYPSVLLKEHFDAVISEGTHFDLKKNSDTIRKTKTDRLIFTHIYPTAAKYINDNLSEFPFDTSVAEDMELFEI